MTHGEDHYNWEKNARKNQRIPPGTWRVWMILAGRGFGKTRTGAETIRQWVQQGKKRLALVGGTEHDALHVMAGGESGLLAVHPSHERPTLLSSQRQLTWKNGAKAYLYSADRPDQLRGPQFDGAWIDEIEKFKDPQQLWDMLNMALRLGQAPQVVITTTPRNMPLLNGMIKESRLNESEVILTRGTSFDNAENLPIQFLASVKKRYGDGLMWQQEIYGRVITETARQELWKPSVFQTQRYDHLPPLDRIIVAVDPAVTSGQNSDETGIIVLGRSQAGEGYVLEDASGKMAPLDWVMKVCHLYQGYQANDVVVEVNQGGEMVKTLLKQVDQNISVKEVRATRGKFMLAAPVAVLYDQGKIFHPRQPLKKLETQMLSMTTIKSPDRVDALVWGVTDLFLNPAKVKIWTI
ncbi:terminase family protein [Alphaproteobacteria bacterium]|nr:terminase family protein [Alphaproteobacteria bacterium]